MRYTRALVDVVVRELHPECFKQPELPRVFTDPVMQRQYEEKKKLSTAKALESAREQAQRVLIAIMIHESLTPRQEEKAHA